MTVEGKGRWPVLKTDTIVIRFQSANGTIDESEIGERSDVLVVIECGEKYRFGFRKCEQSTSLRTTWVEVSNRSITRARPVGASLTDMMLGPYVFGDCQPCLVPADFDFAEVSDLHGE